MIILDTTAIIDLYKKDLNLIRILENIEEELGSTIINYQEVFFGFNPNNESYENEFNFYDKLFNNLDLFNLDRKSIKKAGRLFWKLREKGKVIGSSDCLIAGICLMNGVNKIITKNVDHFKRIKELKVIKY